MAEKDALLTELERQEKYLEELPEEFNFPLFNALRALESQRASAYRDTASAAREIVDNAIEAGASRIHVVLDSAERGTGRSKRRVVTGVAVIDDGPGMLAAMARYALTWGGGTHQDEAATGIGKFGFGLPNASINQTRRVEVYTRNEREPGTWQVILDLGSFNDYTTQSVPPAKEGKLPKFVADYMTRNNFPWDHGTVVVWKNPDRLTYKRPGTLKEHLIDDFGVTYRYLLAPERKAPGVELIVEGTEVDLIDPLFLTPGARWYEPPAEGATDRGGAHLVAEVPIDVVYVENPLTLERHLYRAEEVVLPEDEVEVEEVEDAPRLVELARGTLAIRIARFPVGFAEKKQGPGGRKTDANFRFNVRRERRGISFVRARREIQTYDRLPRSERDRSQGLGRWPLLQSYAYHWGMEVRFPASLDEPLGITNDKQGVRPSEDFWRILAAADIDARLRYENAWQVKERAKPPKREESRDPAPAELAAAEADRQLGSALRVPSHSRAAARAALEAEAKRIAESGDVTVEEARSALEADAQRRRYRVSFYDSEDGPFFKPIWQGTQVVIHINRLHPFHREVYGHLKDARAREGLDLLLLALGKAELTSDDAEMEEWYRVQRVHRWSRFLDTASSRLAAHLTGRGDAGEEPEEPEDEGEDAPQPEADAA